MTINVRVTQEHINNGYRQDSNRCPIACAIQELRKALVVDVDGTSAYWTEPQYDNDDLEFNCSLPLEAREFVLAFDRHEPVAPFEFMLQWR